jgi:hypothetical protein
MRVELGKRLIKQLQDLVTDKTIEEDQIDKVYVFITHVKKNGLINLEGRNKNSDEVPEHYEDYEERRKKAREKKWWHYHIGIDSYSGLNFGDKTSEYIIHYANHNPLYIRLGKLDYHPPFLIPYDDWLVYR